MTDTSLGILEPALRGLGALLEAGGERYWLLVVGGVAINLRQVRQRVTGDVDVIARAERMPDGRAVLFRPEPFPEPLQRAIRQVAADFGLPVDWMNAEIGRMWDQGLPPWIAEDVSWHDYGGLQLGVAGRRTLVALKLWAAVDQGPRSVHAQDLLSLAPSDEELEDAARWVGEQDAAPEFGVQLRQAMAYVSDHRR